MVTKARSVDRKVCRVSELVPSKRPASALMLGKRLLRLFAMYLQAQLHIVVEVFEHRAPCGLHTVGDLGLELGLQRIERGMDLDGGAA